MPGASPASRRGESALAGALLGALALALYLPHVFQSGFYTDDWQELVGRHFHYVTTKLGDYRPIVHLIYDLLYALGGTKPSHYAAAGLGLTIVEGTLLYAVARRLGLGRLAAGCAGVLIVVAPWVDATRLWMATFGEPAGVWLLLAGLLAALHALTRAPGRGTLAWHGVSFALYLAAALCFEGVLAPMVGAVLLYLVVARPARALRRWPFDVAVATAGLVVDAGHARGRGADFAPRHLVDRVDEIGRATLAIVHRALPLDSVTWGPLGFAVLLAGAIGLGTLIGRGSPRVAELRRWAVTLGLGLAFSALGLAALVPAPAVLYTPAYAGAEDRHSVVAAPAEIVVLVAAAWLLGLGIAALARRESLATPFALAAVGVTAVGLVVDEHRVQPEWTLASQEQHRLLRVVAGALGPAPPPGTSVALFRHALVTPSNVPIFETGWDLKGALQLRYDDRTLRAHPFEAPVGCGAAGVSFPDHGGPPDRSDLLPYGRLWFVDGHTGASARVPDAATCLRLLPSYARP